MKYLPRALENILIKSQKQSKVILLTGPRQVGKSTLMNRVFKKFDYVTFDDLNELTLAKDDPQLFIKSKKLPLVIDEVQYAPQIFQTIKFFVDKSEKKGQIFLTGSQTYELLSKSSESLSGRISIIELSSLSYRELNKIKFNLPFIPSNEYLDNRAKELVKYSNIWDIIFRGSMPELLDNTRDWEWFYRDYIKTYIERDIRQIINIKDELKFKSFLSSLAARSANILVYNDIAKDIGVDIKTIQNWVSIVNASGIIKIVEPYSNNIVKRAIKSPKVFFMDTGLLCYLTGWNTPKSASIGAMSGQIFETFVVSEILKSFINAGKDLNHIFYYRDKDMKEIDLLIEDEDRLYPIEVKKSASIIKDWTKNFGVLNKIKEKKIQKGVVICQIDSVIPISENAIAVPVEYI